MMRTKDYTLSLIVASAIVKSILAYAQRIEHINHKFNRMIRISCFERVFMTVLFLVCSVAAIIGVIVLIHVIVFWGILILWN